MASCWSITAETHQFQINLFNSTQNSLLLIIASTYFCAVDRKFFRINRCELIEHFADDNHTGPNCTDTGCQWAELRIWQSKSPGNEKHIVKERHLYVQNKGKNVHILPGNLLARFYYVITNSMQLKKMKELLTYYMKSMKHIENISCIYLNTDLAILSGWEGNEQQI